jgi:hypothetical protein
MTAYATFDNHWEGDHKAYLFKTTDAGKTWKTIAGDNMQTYLHIVKEDLVNPNLIFVGSERGLFVSINGGSAWAQFTGNLPNVSVRDMVIHPTKHDLVLATHGRGIMIIDDLTALRSLKPEMLEQDVVFLASRPYEISNLGMMQSFTGDDEFSGQNPPQNANIYFYLKKRHVFGDMFIDILDKSGNVIQNIPCDKGKGINHASWAIRKKAPKVPASNVLTPNALFGPSYEVGEYTVRLTKGDKKYETKIELRNAANSPHSEADRKLQFDAVMKAYRLLEDLGFLDKNLVLMTEKITAIKAEPKSDLEKNIKPMLTDLSNLREELVLTKVSQVNSDERLREKISGIYGAMIRYEGRPTNSQLERLDVLRGIFEEKKKDFEKITSQLAALNLLLTKRNLPNINLISREDFDKIQE